MKKIRLESWYWGNFEWENSRSCKKSGWKIGTKAHGYKFEEYIESEHGWHHGEEFKSAKCFNSKLLLLAVELDTLDISTIKKEFNARYEDNLNDCDIEVGLSKKYLVFEDICWRFKDTANHNFSILDSIPKKKDVWFKSGLELSEEQKEELISMLTKRCGQRVKTRIRSLITYDFSTIVETGYLDRFYISSHDDFIHYNAGQCYPSEIKWIRQAIIRRFP